MSQPADAPESVTGVKGETRIEEPTAAERAIARRSAESRATVPDIEFGADVDMAACVALRAAHGYSALALLVRACALALRELPRVNGAYRDGRYELYSRINVGVTLATADAYVTPAINDAERKSLAELTAEIDGLAQRAGAGELTPPELSGTTFTVTDFGAHQITRADAIINLGQGAALAAGAVRELPVIRDGAVAIGPVASLTLVADHRLLHGDQGARFLARVKELLEQAAETLV
jgi:pyruvate dehydrogenase E2 component (dihydrolipoamide acetyltransferase)